MKKPSNTYKKNCYELFRVFLDELCEKKDIKCENPLDTFKEFFKVNEFRYVMQPDFTIPSPYYFPYVMVERLREISEKDYPKTREAYKRLFEKGENLVM